MSQLATFPPNQLPDTSKYPTLTVLPMLIMACIAARAAEEVAFRGHCWTILERQFRPTSVVVFSSLLFALANFTQGRVLANLLVYFLAGIWFAGVAYAAKSIWARVPVHALADLVAFTLLWPRLYAAGRVRRSPQRLVLDPCGAGTHFHGHYRAFSCKTRNVSQEPRTIRCRIEGHVDSTELTEKPH